MRQSKAAIYARVSTGDQTNSMQAQLDRLYAYAKQHDLSIYKQYTEVVSGASKKRKQFNEMIRESELKCFDVILITNLSRFSRGTLVSVLTILNELEEQKIKVVALDQNFDTTTPIGRAFMGMTVLLSELERDMSMERGRAGYQHAKDLGHFIFRPPFGYTTEDKKLVEVPEEAKIVREIYADRKVGMKLREIHEKHNMTLGTIHYILNNPVYKTGTFYAKDKIYLEVEPIVKGD